MNATTPPSWAKPLLERVSKLGATIATSSTTKREEVVAFAVALPNVAFAVTRERSDHPVAVVGSWSADDAMAIVRSLVVRSARRVAEGGVVSTQFDDLESIALDRLPPQFFVAPADTWGRDWPRVSLAVGCTWAEMALTPEEREAAVRARSRDGATANDVLAPLDGAFDGIARALRKANEPLLKSAAWVMQSLIAEHTALARQHLAKLAVQKGLDDDRRDLVGALCDELNPRLLSGLRPGPRAVLTPFRMPQNAGGALAVAFFYPDSESRTSKLVERHPEPDLARHEIDAGFATLGRIFERHQGLIAKALEQHGGFKLQRGYHTGVSLKDAIASFEADGFVPVSLVLDDAP